MAGSRWLEWSPPSGDAADLLTGWPHSGTSCRHAYATVCLTRCRAGETLLKPLAAHRLWLRISCLPRGHPHPTSLNELLSADISSFGHPRKCVKGPITTRRSGGAASIAPTELHGEGVRRQSAPVVTVSASPLIRPLVFLAPRLPPPPCTTALYHTVGSLRPPCY